MNEKDLVRAENLAKQDQLKNQQTLALLTEAGNNPNINLSSDVIQGSAFSVSKEYLKDIERINETILSLNNKINVKEGQIAKYSSKPTSQVAISLSDDLSQLIKERDNLVKEVELLKAGLPDVLNADASSANLPTIPSTTQHTMEANKETLANADSNVPPKYQYNEKDLLYNGPTSDDYMAVAQNILASAVHGLHPEHFKQQYNPENILHGGGQFFYDTFFEKAKSQGEDSQEAFLKDSDTIRVYLEEISSNPEIMALVEIAAQNGIKTDEQMFSLIFDSVYYDHDYATANNFKVSAKKTLTGIQHIKNGDFDTEEAKRIINRLGLKGKEAQFANTLIFATGGR